MPVDNSACSIRLVECECVADLWYLLQLYCCIRRVATNLEYSGISLYMENSQTILCNLRKWLTLRSGCSLCQAIHMLSSVSGAKKLLIWTISDNIGWLVSWLVGCLDFNVPYSYRLLLVMWVVGDEEWPLIYEGCYYVYIFVAITCGKV